MTAKVVGPKCFLAPNGTTKVKVFPHGFVKFLSGETKETEDLVAECSRMALGMVPENAEQCWKAFEIMGWTETCETHHWVLKVIPNTPDGPGERIKVCKDCGAEWPGEGK